ncbi:MAG: glycosyltransferase family 2 protein [Flavobacteriia bacterium]|jgi:glycosyltransferase involved in cell wall biosynthesis
MDSKDNVFVVVLMIAYNHENYIAKAIQSVLDQKTNFKVKLIIGDDSSIDNTSQICIEFKSKFNSEIELFIHEKNIGANKNLRFIYDKCFQSEARYIAVLEGDDYWTDEFKLQKQIDFLEKNPDFSSCFTNSLIFHQKANYFEQAKKQIWNEANSLELLEHDDFKGDNLPMSPGHTSTFVFRNKLFSTFPDWFSKLKVCDFPLFMIVSKFGKAKFIDENTSVYRICNEGSSSKGFQFNNHTIERILIYKKLNDYFSNKYTSKISEIIAKHYFNLAKFNFKNNSKMVAFKNLMNAFKHKPSYIVKFLFK